MIERLNGGRLVSHKHVVLALWNAKIDFIVCLFDLDAIRSTRAVGKLEFKRDRSCSPQGPRPPVQLIELPVNYRRYYGGVYSGARERP